MKHTIKVLNYSRFRFILLTLLAAMAFSPSATVAIAEEVGSPMGQPPPVPTQQAVASAQPSADPGAVSVPPDSTIPPSPLSEVVETPATERIADPGYPSPPIVASIRFGNQARVAIMEFPPNGNGGPGYMAMIQILIAGRPETVVRTFDALSYERNRNQLVVKTTDGKTITFYDSGEYLVRGETVNSILGLLEREQTFRLQQVTTPDNRQEYRLNPRRVILKREGKTVQAQTIQYNSRGLVNYLETNRYMPSGERFMYVMREDSSSRPNGTHFFRVFRPGSTRSSGGDTFNRLPTLVWDSSGLLLDIRGGSEKYWYSINLRRDRVVIIKRPPRSSIAFS